MLNKCVMIECPTIYLPHVQTAHPALSTPHIDDCVINIQPPYNTNTLMKSELWNGNFHPISLHGFIEYLASDSKNIKNSLNFMAKYIPNKQVNSSKSNDLKDFNSISKAI